MDPYPTTQHPQPNPKTPQLINLNIQQPDNDLSQIRSTLKLEHQKQSLMSNVVKVSDNEEQCVVGTVVERGWKDKDKGKGECQLTETEEELPGCSLQQLIAIHSNLYKIPELKTQQTQSSANQKAAMNGPVKKQSKVGNKLDIPVSNQVHNRFKIYQDYIRVLQNLLSTKLPTQKCPQYHYLLPQSPTKPPTQPPSYPPSHPTLSYSTYKRILHLWNLPPCPLLQQPIHTSPTTPHYLKFIRYGDLQRLQYGQSRRGYKGWLNDQVMGAYVGMLQERVRGWVLFDWVRVQGLVGGVGGNQGQVMVNRFTKYISACNTYKNTNSNQPCTLKYIFIINNKQHWFFLTAEHKPPPHSLPSDQQKPQPQTQPPQPPQSPPQHQIIFTVYDSLLRRHKQFQYINQDPDLNRPLSYEEFVRFKFGVDVDEDGGQGQRGERGDGGGNEDRDGGNYEYGLIQKRKPNKYRYIKQYQTYTQQHQTRHTNQLHQYHTTLQSHYTKIPTIQTLLKFLPKHSSILFPTIPSMPPTTTATTATTPIKTSLQVRTTFPQQGNSSDCGMMVLEGIKDVVRGRIGWGFEAGDMEFRRLVATLEIVQGYVYGM